MAKAITDALAQQADAMAKQPEAADKAKQEAEEKLVPSQPQMWVGPAIAERLKQLAERPDQ